MDFCLFVIVRYSNFILFVTFCSSDGLAEVVAKNQRTYENVTHI